MSAPLIGITTAHGLATSDNPFLRVNETYVRALADAGACPVLIPLGLPEAALDELLARLDGVLFSGGGDVHPGAYGSLPHPRVDGVDSDRDRVEIHLLQGAMAARKPFLGICRGLQVINVAWGGTLYEDILDQRPEALQHQWSGKQPRDYPAHRVEVAPGSRLESIFGGLAAQVNSLHHQGILTLAPGLVPTAYAPDGLIEAFEAPDHPFGIGVQWHPECLPNQPEMRALFQAFARAAQK